MRILQQKTIYRTDFTNIGRLANCEIKSRIHIIKFSLVETLFIGDTLETYSSRHSVIAT